MNNLLYNIQVKTLWLKSGPMHLPYDPANWRSTKLTAILNASGHKLTVCFTFQTVSGNDTYMNWGPNIGVFTSSLATVGLTGLTAGAAGWGLFQWLGKRWIEDHFSKELEAFKAERQAELEKLRTEYGRETERLKADLNRFADRASRFHVREYEVLPEAWGLMNKAYGAASNAISAYREHPDLDRMGQAQFAAWLENSGLEQFQKEELNLATDKNQHYATLLNWKQISDAQNSAIEFINYVILQGIFISESLTTKMMDAGMNMRKAIISRTMAERLTGQSYVAGQTNFNIQAMNEIQAVELVVLEVKHEIRQLLSNIRFAPPAAAGTDDPMLPNL